MATRKEPEAEGTAGMDDRRNDGRGARMASEGGGHGNRTVMADPTGITTSVYDDRNLIQSVTDPDGKTVSYSYNALGLRATMTDPDSGVTTYAYDDAMRLESVVNPQGKVTTFSYDLAGRKIQIDHEASLFPPSPFLCSAEGASRPPSVFAGGGLSRACPRSLASSLRTSQQCLQNLRSGQLPLKSRKSLWINARGQAVTSTYNSNRERVGEEYPGGRLHTYTYTYDDAGNRTVMADATGVTTGAG